ncbi:MAG: hypothetical protein FWC16_05275 [Defluviitaleaceae bacterium]|nr:hypothetical protein [Defluviitaleaceae bacterium]MCL2274319.1 hypothetical protein [Defluviitaleaceae bacterium]
MNPIRNTHGISMMELIVSMVVISLIMVAVTTVFAPMLQTFRRANSFAEANPMMDNIAMLMLDDIKGAVNRTEIDGYGNLQEITGIFPIRGSSEDSLTLTVNKMMYSVRYDISSDGLITREFIGVGTPTGVEPLFAPEFFLHKVMSFEWDFDDDAGTVALLLRVTYRPNQPNTWYRERTYVVRPLGLQP